MILILQWPVAHWVPESEELTFFIKVLVQLSTPAIIYKPNMTEFFSSFDEIL